MRELMLVHLPKAEPDFEAWFARKHGATLGEAWKTKRMRAVIAYDCELWAVAQHAQRAQTDKEIKLGIYKGST